MIAKSFTLGRTECSFLSISKPKSSDFFVTCYDGSLNRLYREEQMDVILRYFNNESCLFGTSYFDSDFLKRPNSYNLFLKSLSTFVTGID